MIPAGLDVTVPAPAPDLPAASVKLWTANAAVTDCVAFTVTVHVVPETESQPVQLVKVEPAAGVAVRVTVVPAT